MTPSRSIATALVVFALALSACGNDPGVSGPTPTSTIPATLPPADEIEDVDVSDTGAGATGGSADESLPPNIWPESDASAPTGFDPAATEPPPVVLTRGDQTLTLPPVTYCWTPPDGGLGICADGIRPDPLPELGGNGPITLAFPPSLDFTFSASVWDDGAAGDGPIPLDVTQAGGAWTITVPDDLPAQVDVFGAGPDGDVFVSLLLT